MKYAARFSRWHLLLFIRRRKASESSGNSSVTQKRDDSGVFFCSFVWNADFALCHPVPERTSEFFPDWLRRPRGVAESGRTSSNGAARGKGQRSPHLKNRRDRPQNPKERTGRPCWYARFWQKHPSWTLNSIGISITFLMTDCVSWHSVQLKCNLLTPKNERWPSKKINK